MWLYVPSSQNITAHKVYKYGHGIDASMLCLHNYSYLVSALSCGYVTKGNWTSILRITIGIVPR